MGSTEGMRKSGSLLMAAALFAGCGKTAADRPAGPPPAMHVQVRIAELQKIPDTTEYLSILKSRHTAAIKPQVEGQVTKIFVKSGDQVRPGTALLQIDPLKQEATVGSQEAARAAQEANARYAKTQLERQQKLYAAGVVPKADLENAQTAYEAALAQLHALEHQVRQEQVQLHYYTVQAPMEGTVGDIPVREGDRVSVSTLLTTVNEPGALEAYIYVPADRARGLRIGASVRLMDSAGNVIAATQITFVSPEVDLGTQTVLAKAVVEKPQGKLRVDQQVRAQVIWSTHSGTVIPVLSVTRINGQFFAFVATHEGKGTVARQKLLKVGDTIGNNYVVLDGLKAGDHVIVSGLQFLQDGTPVVEQVQSG